MGWSFIRWSHSPLTRWHLIGLCAHEWMCVWIVKCFQKAIVLICICSTGYIHKGSRCGKYLLWFCNIERYFVFESWHAFGSKMACLQLIKQLNMCEIALRHPVSSNDQLKNRREQQYYFECSNLHCSRRENTYSCSVTRVVECSTRWHFSSFFVKAHAFSTSMQTLNAFRCILDCFCEKHMFQFYFMAPDYHTLSIHLVHILIILGQMLKYVHFGVTVFISSCVCAVVGA